MQHIGPTTIATWICVILVILVVAGVLRAFVKPLVVVAIVAILLVAVGAVSGDEVSRAAREFVAGAWHVIATLFGAASGH